MKVGHSISTHLDLLGGVAQASGAARKVLCLLAFGLLLGFPSGAVAAEKPSEEAAAKPVSIDPRTAPLAEAIADFGAAVQADDLKRAQRWSREPKELAKNWPGVKAQHKQFGYDRWIKEATKRESRPADAKEAPEEDPNRFTVGGHMYRHLHINWEKGENGWRIAAFFICK